MPSTKKTLYFISSALATCASVGLLGFGMSAQWAKTTILCSRGGDNHYNGTAVINIGLFEGMLKREDCPVYRIGDGFEVIPTLNEIGGAPIALHILVVLLLVLCLLSSAGSILVSFYNSVSNPYETYMGPVGVYTCSSIGACSSVASLIIFVVSLNVTDVAEDLVRNFSGAVTISLKDASHQMLVGYFMLIPYFVFSLGAIALIYMYDHAAYTHRREQQRPTEDAPKEIMMY